MYLEKINKIKDKKSIAEQKIKTLKKDIQKYENEIQDLEDKQDLLRMSELKECLKPTDIEKFIGFISNNDLESAKRLLNKRS